MLGTPLYNADFAHGLYEVGGVPYSSFSAFCTAMGFTGNRPRFKYSPDGKPLGALLEGVRTNKVYPSDDFTSANWWKGATTFANGLLSETTATVFHQMTFPVPVAANGRHTVSFVLAAGTVDLVSLWIGNGIGFAVDVDLAAGTIGTPYDWGLACTEKEAHIESLGNGEYRCVISGKVPTYTTLNCGVIMRNGAGTPTQYAGNTSRNIRVISAQVEAASTATSHIRTRTGPVTRTADVMQRSFVSSPSAVTQLVKFRTGMGAPNDVAGDHVYAVATHLDNNNGPNYSDIDVFWYKDGHVYVEIHKGPGPATTRAKVDLGFVASMTDIAVAYTASASGLIASLNGGAVVVDSVDVWPDDLTHDRIGQNAWGSDIRAMNSTVARVATWFDEVASCAELVAMSAL